MDELDEKLLVMMQDDFPLAERPYAVMGERLGLSEEAAFARVEAWARTGVIRRMGPRFNTRRLGLVSTLVAASTEKLEETARAICGRNEVTHCYERAGSRYNIWFTLNGGSEEEVATLLEELRRRTGATMHSLKAEKVYKLGVRFLPGASKGNARCGMTAVETPNSKLESGGKQPTGRVGLGEVEKKIIAGMQGGLPVVRRPYEAAARAMGMETGELIAELEKMRREGTIRTMGAVADGPALGYRGNALVAWRVAAGECDRAGETLAKFAEVSHCYRRPALADFPYTLYTMVHGRDGEDCREIVKRMEAASGLKEHAALETRREFKKSAPVFAGRLS